MNKLANFDNDADRSQLATDLLMQIGLDEKIIQVSNSEVAKTSTTQYVPGWFSITTEYWSQGDLSDSEFIHGIEWLIEHGVIKV